MKLSRVVERLIWEMPVMRTMMLLIILICGIPSLGFSARSANRDKTHGGKRMLAILPISKSDSKKLTRIIESSEKEIRYLYQQLDVLWRHTSYGKLWVEKVDTPVVYIKQTTDKNAARKAAAKVMGFGSVEEMSEDYDFITLIYHEGQKFRGGVAGVGGKNAKIGAYNYNTLIHETGHNLGQGIHYGCWIPYQSKDIVGGSGIFIKNGHPYAPLSGYGNRLGFPLQTKQLFGWVSMGKSSDSDIRIINNSSKIRIHRYDVPHPQKTLGVLIDRAGMPLGHGNDSKSKRFGHYLLSFATRQESITQPVDGDRKLPGQLPKYIGNGLIVERVIYDAQRNRLSGTTIIDCNPRTQSSKIKGKHDKRAIEELSDCFLTVGQTFNDAEAGISIETLAIDGQEQDRYIDVEVILKE
jgi:hypothetical protein